MRLTVGILALQGDFYKHQLAVEKLGHHSLAVKDAGTLSGCDKLIIPGGESTTLLHLIEKLDLRAALCEFGRTHAVMGTCAGLILLGKSSEKLPHAPLHLIDVQVARNAYGRQIDSFVDTVQVKLDNARFEFEGVFIRAPKITALGKDVTALAYHHKDVVMAASKNVLVATFHPELTEDLRIHEYFLDNVG